MGGAQSRRGSRREGRRGVDVVARILEYKKNGRINATHDRDLDDEERLAARGFDAFQPETRDALNNLVDATVRDYVKYWYSPIVPSDRSFPLSCRKVLTSFLLSVSNHIGRKRPADAFLDFLTNSSSIVIVFFSELSAAFAEVPGDSKMSAANTVYNYLASNPESNLANLLSQRQQAGKFKMVAEDLLASWTGRPPTAILLGSFCERSSPAWCWKRHCRPARHPSG